MMEDFNIDDFSEGEELNPSAYNPEDYPTGKSSVSCPLKPSDSAPLC